MKTFSVGDEVVFRATKNREQPFNKVAPGYGPFKITAVRPAKHYPKGSNHPQDIQIDNRELWFNGWWFK